MRILFTTDHEGAVSTVLNAPNYARLNDLPGVRIDFYNRNYAHYDVVLFMGYDPQVREAKAANPRIKVGIVDPRPPTLEACLGADFVVANGIEMQDWLADYFGNIFIYPIYPSIKPALKVHRQRRPLIIGYHGNKVHLQTMFPYVTTALEALAEEHTFEVWAIYDVRSLGGLPAGLCDCQRFRIRCFQWTEAAYERYLSNADIGIVPNLIPILNQRQAAKQIESMPELFGENDYDVLLRFKPTSNPGRIFVFSQCGIPVVADMFPSACQIIRDGYSGFLAQGAGGWYRALKQLADSPGLRQTMGKRLQDEFEITWSVEILNRTFLRFLGELDPNTIVPPTLRNAANGVGRAGLLQCPRQ